MSADSHEAQIKALLAKSLEGNNPRVSARQILLAERKRRRGRNSLRIAVATAACLLLMLASLNMPMVARAISSIPIVGDTYLNFIKGSGLDIAYQAGFVSELGNRQERFGITLTVLGAYADSTETSVMFTLSCADKELLKQVIEGSYTPWADPNRIDATKDLHPWLKGALSGSSTMQYDETEGVIYGLVSVDSRRGFFNFGSSETLQIEAGVGQPVWQVSFPVQSVPGEYVETVKVNKSFHYDNAEITINEVIFSPAQTVVVYSTTGPKGAIKLSNWAVKTFQGVELTALGGRFGTDGFGLTHKGKGMSRFTPTDDRNLSIFFLGQHESFSAKLDLPLRAGAMGCTTRGDFTIESIDDGSQTLIRLSWSGISNVQKLGAELWSPDRQTVIPLEDYCVQEDLLSLIFPGVVLEDQWILSIDEVILDSQELIKVYEITQ